jgi:class 3 adenylate cyclase
MGHPKSILDVLREHQTARWVISFFALVFAWSVTPFSVFDREIAPIDLEVGEADAVVSLESFVYRYDFVPQGQKRPECPGIECPLNLEADPDALKYKRDVKNIFTHLMTSEGWRGAMYLRWDLQVPSFVSEVGQPVAFDFYGIAGKSWRLFVNGREVASGVGGPKAAAINFPAPGLPGAPLSLGMEIDVGRGLAPGVILVAQTFLSRPSIAPHLRLAYRGLDKENLIPVGIGYTILALLAAFSCFLTPFYREILAFSLWVSVVNWRLMLMNDLVDYPMFLNVDFVTFGAMLNAAALACQWAFFVLFFRVKNQAIWMPVKAYAALIPLLWISGRYGLAVDSLIFMHRSFEFQLSVVHLGGSILAFNVWWATRGKTWAKFRVFVSAGIGLMSFGVALGYLLLALVRPSTVTLQALTDNANVFQVANYGSRAFIFCVGFAVALEWALIVRDRQRVLQRFGTIVDPRLVHDIIRGPEGHSRRIDHVVVLFTDLRSFTKMCEVFSPDRVMKALNDYLDVVTTAVQAHGGIVDKFVGDAVMALWGVPELGEKDSYAAICAAMDIRIGMAKLNARRVSEGDFALDVGVGIHGGPTIFGAVGNGSRVDHTVIGPTINIASRLEGVTKDYHCDIVISHTVLEKVESQVLVEDLGLISIRGMSSQVGAAKLIGVQISDNEFVIGNEILQEAVSLRRPGRVTQTPATVTTKNYVSNDQVQSSKDAAA